MRATGISAFLDEGRGAEIIPQMQAAMLEKEKVVQSGFIAQEVEQAAREQGYDFSGVDLPKNENDFYGLRYAEFVVPLVRAVQEQQEIIQELQAQLAQVRKELTHLSNIISE